MVLRTTCLLSLCCLLYCCTAASVPKTDPHNQFLPRNEKVHKSGTPDTIVDDVVGKALTDLFGPDAAAESQSIRIFPNTPSGRLAHAKHLSSTGNYAEATRTYYGLYTDVEADKGIRAEACFRLGQLYSSLLNQQRNEKVAVYFFEKLLSDFRNSEFQAEAQARLAILRQNQQR